MCICQYYSIFDVVLNLLEKLDDNFGGLMTAAKKLLGMRIKELRRTRSLSQEQLAEMIEIDPKHLSRIEVGNSYPSLDTLEKMANALKTDLKDFFEFKHHGEEKELIENINRILSETNKSNLKLIFRIIRAVTL
jgi:transcriptional regulator with XRE-family HTH domain